MVITKYIFRFSTLFLFCLPLPASEETHLDVFLKGLTTLSGEFSQRVENPQLSSADQASGKLWISRPGKFRWNYDVPYKQEIVSDGNKVWIYDVDLEQITVKAANTTLGNTPAMLLSSDRPIADSFDVRQTAQQGQLRWLELIPKDSEAGFKNILLGFEGETLRQMNLEDNLGQRTQLTFNHLLRNEKLSPSIFEFAPPKGVDVFDSSGE